MKGKNALINGASKGFGYALAHSLAEQGWSLVLTARNEEHLSRAREQLSGLTEVSIVVGDISEEKHQLALMNHLVREEIKLDLVVNNASELGISPMKPVLEYPVDKILPLIKVNTVAPVAVLQRIMTRLEEGAQIVNVSSDAAVEAYETWGIYGASKAALDHLTAVLAKEHENYYFYSFDPGDMRTDMHQLAFPGEDISDRPLPREKAVPALLDLLSSKRPSGRYSVELLETPII